MDTVRKSLCVCVCVEFNTAVGLGMIEGKGKYK